MFTHDDLVEQLTETAFGLQRMRRSLGGNRPQSLPLVRENLDTFASGLLSLIDRLESNREHFARSLFPEAPPAGEWSGALPDKTTAPPDKGEAGAKASDMPPPDKKRKV